MPHYHPSDEMYIYLHVVDFFNGTKKGECSSPMDGMGAFSNIEKESSWWFQNS